MTEPGLSASFILFWKFKSPEQTGLKNTILTELKSRGTKVWRNTLFPFLDQFGIQSAIIRLCDYREAQRKINLRIRNRRNYEENIWVGCGVDMGYFNSAASSRATHARS